MAIIAIASIPTLTSCTKHNENTNNSYVQLDNGYKDNIIKALSSENTTVKYIEFGDYYIIDEDIYIYDYENNKNTYITTNTYTISRAVAISEGIYELVENKVVKNSIRH